jgi:predicted RNA-binding Zn ribbon-like protein
MRMLGGAPALDLANTLHRRDGHTVDFIPGYGELLDFCVPARLLSKEDARAIKRLAEDHPGAARKVHGELLELRTALKAWLTLCARNLNNGVPPNSAAADEIREAVVRAGGTAGLGGMLNPVPASAGEAVYLPLRRSAAAAAMLVLFPPANDIRRCEADHCGGFFIDDSRSKPRRWCSMDGCGNRAKAARYRLAHRK